MTHRLLAAIEANDLEDFEKALRGTLAEAGGREALQGLVAEEGHSPTTLAASLGRVDMVKAMVDAGLDMGLKDRRSMTPLHEAAAHGHADVVHTLLNDPRLDRNPMTEGLRETPVHLAAGNGHAAVLSMLAKRDANIVALDHRGNGPEHHAAQGGHPAALRVLREEFMVGLMDGNGNGDTPAHLAAAENKREVIREIGRLQGARALEQPNKEGNLPIHVAASVGFHEVVRALAEAGVSLDAPNRGGLTPAKAAATPLERQMAEKPMAPMFDETGANPAQVLNVLREFGVDVPLQPARPQWEQLLGGAPKATADAPQRNVKALGPAAPGGLAL
jgi:ankyrin repeat protein